MASDQFVLILLVFFSGHIHMSSHVILMSLRLVTESGLTCPPNPVRCQRFRASKIPESRWSKAVFLFLDSWTPGVEKNSSLK